MIIDQEIGGVTQAMREGAQAWTDHQCQNPYPPNTQEHTDWNWGWDESQNHYEWLESLSDDTLQ